MAACLPEGTYKCKPPQGSANNNDVDSTMWWMHIMASNTSTKGNLDMHIQTLKRH